MADSDFVDGFRRYDAFPQNAFHKRDLPTPHFGRAIEIRGGNQKPVRTLAWSCDGKRVATGTEVKGLRVWQTRTGAGAQTVTIDGPSNSQALPSSSKTPNPHNGHIAAVAWSPTEPHTLVSGCKSGMTGGVVAVWDVRSPAAPLTTFNIQGDVLHLAFHPSGTQFAAVCPRSIRDEVHFFWLVTRDGEEKWEQRTDIMLGGAGIDMGVEEINSFRFWLGGDAVMSVSNDGSLSAWKFPVEERPPLFIAVEPPTAVSTPRDDKEDLDSRPLKKSRVDSPDTPEAEEPALDEARDSEGREGGEGEEDTPAEIENGPEGENPADEDAPGANAAEGGEETTQVEGDTEAAEDVATTPASAEASAAPSAPATAPASIAASPAPVREATPAEDEAAAKAATEAAAKAATAVELERRKHRQLEKCFRQMPHVASLLSLAVDPRGRYFAVGGQDARLSLLDTRDWIVQRNFDAPTAAIRNTAFSPDGELIAVGGDDPCIYILATTARTTVARIPVTGSVNALAWHPTRNTLAYSTNAKTGIVWYVVSQE